MLEHPIVFAAFSLAVIAGSYLCYQALGSDLLPSMDEGGFIVDYLMPAGSWLEDTNRTVSAVEGILRATPEVESTSRRTGLQLGLAAVTEANRADISQAEAQARLQCGGGGGGGAREGCQAGCGGCHQEDSQRG
jgi:multidrug efflux pump subunit AcrB